MITENEGKPTEGMREQLIAGSLWMALMRWTIRGLGVVSTLILARLLDPADFGLVAMATLFASLLEILTSFGVEMALIQRPDATREHWDTAWTIRLLQNTCVAIAVAALAPMAAVYFSEPRVVVVMRVLSISIAVEGLANIGTVAFRKELRFHREFQFRVAVKLGSFFLTIALAIIWRNYWALVVGILMGRTLAVVLSYVLHPYRPRFTLVRVRDIWSFSQWMLLRSLGMYVRRQVDGFLVGHHFSTFQMGLYRVSNEIAQMPTTELATPIRVALFPGYAKLSSEPRRVGLAYLKALGVLTTITMPAAIGLALVADPLVLVALGPKWADAGVVMAWLSVFGFLLTTSTGVQAPLMALGRLPRTVAVVWAQIFVCVPIVVAAARYGSVATVAMSQALTALLFLPVFLFAMTSLRIVAWREILAAIARPVMATAVMAACLGPLRSAWSMGPIPDLIVSVLVGAASYVASLLILWRSRGYPDGPERVILGLLRSWLPGRRDGSSR